MIPAALRFPAILAALLASSGVLPLAAEHQLAIAQFAGRATALFPSSRFTLRVLGMDSPQRVELFGNGELHNGAYIVSSNAKPGIATLVAIDPNALAVRTFRIVPPPPVRATIAVASYDDGITFHDERSFALLGTLATGGASSDIAVDPDGTFTTTDTDGDTLTSVSLVRWDVRSISGVQLGEQLLVDPQRRALYATERGINSEGTLVRIGGGKLRRLVTGDTPEGMALDARRKRLYVANVNSNDVAIVDVRRMRAIGRIPNIPRAFNAALSGDGSRLYVVSNQGRATIFGAPGAVREFSVISASHVRIIAQSADLPFPVGIALNSTGRLLFVTDEESNAVYVLDAHTLAQRHPPLPTCEIPWKPTLDPRTDRLYIPCAGSDEVDVFNARTFTRVPGAPFKTSGYPLAVAVWYPR